MLVGLERDLWVLMAELATAPANRHEAHRAAQNLVTNEMVSALEASIDDAVGAIRAADRVRRARRDAVSPPCSTWPAPSSAVPSAHALAVADEDSYAVPYLNRLSDLLWTMARWQEGTSLPSREDQ